MSTIPGYNEPFPTRDRIVDDRGYPTRLLIDWFEQTLGRRLTSTPVLTDPLTRVPSSTPSAGTNATETGTLGGTQSTGLYQLNAYLETIVADAGGAPSCVLTITFTHNGKSLARIYPALSGLLTTSVATVTDTIEVDPNTSVGYVLTYVSGTTPGLFRYYAAMGLQLLQPLS